ncbi:MAG: 2-C-methyl-D-erythritol 2,4-cyclodiphosphate synthase [Thermodesulfobacteriota bacterium]
MYRIGIGFDAHRFSKDRKLILGGVHVPFELGLKGHSDADVLTHAICDSILGAMGKGDIGIHFPDADDSLKDISSLVILSRVVEMVRDFRMQIVNIDAVVICERPRVTPFREQIEGVLADCMQLDNSCINIKATTTEGMGYTGEGKGIAAKSICLLKYI